MCVCLQVGVCVTHTLSCRPIAHTHARNSFLALHRPALGVHRSPFCLMSISVAAEDANSVGERRPQRETRSPCLHPNVFRLWGPDVLGGATTNTAALGRGVTGEEKRGGEG